MTHKLNPALKEFWRTRADVKVLKGGRASGKTWDAAAMAIFLAANYSLRFLCVRQFQANISDSVYTVLCEMIDRMGYTSEFEIQKTTIIHRETGSEFIFFGFQRNTASIKGTEGVDICWIEEAESLTKEQWEIIEPTIRKEGSECWILYNPRLAADFVERNFKHDPGNKTIVRIINYIENPYLSEKMLRTIERAKERDFSDYEHIYLGVPRSDDDSAVIKRSWILAAIDAHKKVKGNWHGLRTMGYDVADSGSDYNGAVFVDGFVCKAVYEWKAAEDELFISTKKVLGYANHHKCSQIGYDSIGVGSGVGGNLNELRFTNHFKFNAGAKVHKPNRKYADTKIPNEQFFSNIKAQMWWMLADKFKNTFNAIHKGYDIPVHEMISIDSEGIKKKDLEKLIDELSTPFRDFDVHGKVKVESKKDLAKRGVPSPNLADAFVIAFSRSLLRISGGSVNSIL